MRELEHDRDRCFQVGDEPRPSNLRLALIVATREAWKVRLDGMSPALRVELRDGGFRRAHCSSSLPASLPRAFWVTVTPYRCSSAAEYSSVASWLTSNSICCLRRSSSFGSRAPGGVTLSTWKTMRPSSTPDGPEP